MRVLGSLLLCSLDSPDLDHRNTTSDHLQHHHCQQDATPPRFIGTESPPGPGLGCQKQHVIIIIISISNSVTLCATCVQPCGWCSAACCQRGS